VAYKIIARRDCQTKKVLLTRSYRLLSLPAKGTHANIWQSIMIAVKHSMLLKTGQANAVGKIIAITETIL
jgi:hypothetical protein